MFIFFPRGGGGGSNCDATDSCNDAAGIALIVIACVLVGIVVLSCCYLCIAMCLSEYEERAWRNRRDDDELPEVPPASILELIRTRNQRNMPVVEHVVNVKPPPAVTFHIESVEQLQPVQNGESIAIVVD